MSSSELQWCSLVEGKQNFWQIFIPCGLFIIIFLVILQLLQQRRRRKNKIEQMQTEMQMILKEDESYIEVVRSTIAVIQEALEDDCAEIQVEIESAREVMKSNETRLAQIRNIKYSVEMIKAQLQNQMELIEKATAVENTHLAIAQMEKEVRAMKMVSTDKMVGDPESMESPVKMRTPRKSYTAASNDAANKKRLVSISKIPVSSVRLPYAKPVDSREC
jgi:hypothetical protein